MYNECVSKEPQYSLLVEIYQHTNGNVVIRLAEPAQPLVCSDLVWSKKLQRFLDPEVLKKQLETNE